MQISTLNKYQTLIIGLAVILGLIIGQNQIIAIYSQNIITPSLMLMLFGIFLNISIKDLIKRFSNIKFITTSIAINFIWTPIFAYLLGYIFLKNEISLWIGFVMLMVTPCTDWYLIFTGIAKGNIALSAAVLPINLILQIILLPVYIYLFFGKSEAVNFKIFFESIVLVLFIPFFIAQIIRKLLFSKVGKEKRIKFLFDFFETGQIIFLSIAIIGMFASQGRYLTQNISITLTLLTPLSIFFVFNFFLSRIVSFMLKFNYEDSVSLSLTTLARNSPISLAIAVVAFPNEPLIALALVIAPMIELPVLGIVSQILLKIKK